MTDVPLKIASSVAPVLGVAVAISVLRSAGLPFPPALDSQAWAQWVVFATLVWAATSLFLFTANRLFKARPPAGAL